MLLLAEQFFFDPMSRRYLADASDLGLTGDVHSCFALSNCPEEGQHRSFVFKKHIVGPEDEIQGWFYEEAAGPNYGIVLNGGKGEKATPLTVLIAND